MKKTEIQAMKEKLSILIDKPLQSVSRAGGSILIHFGELIDKEVRKKNQNSEGFVKKTISIGKLALHIECNSRFICGDSVFLGKYDMYQPSSEVEKKLDFDWNNFDWDVKGKNKFDEITSSLFDDTSVKFIVKKIEINKLGDIKIHLTNNFVLEIIIDTSLDIECWRFFELNTDNHLVVGGRGII